jgi:sec-independent protein translocase protein TatB
VFDLSPEKLLLIGIIALLVLGPDRLPGAARSLGRLVHQLRAMSGNLQSEMSDALAEPRKIIDDAVGEMGLPSVPRVPNVRRTVSQALFSPLDDEEPVTAATSSPSVAWQDTAGASARTSGESALPDDPNLN